MGKVGQRYEGQKIAPESPSLTPATESQLLSTDPLEGAMNMCHAEFTVAELRERAGLDAFGSAGAAVVGIDGPHEDDWSLYTTLTLDDGRELETILHHRAGKPLGGDCTCAPALAGIFCSHLVWVGLVHLGLDAPPQTALAAETAPADDLRAWLGTLTSDELIDLVIQAAGGNQEYRRHLHLRVRQS